MDCVMSLIRRTQAALVLELRHVGIGFGERQIVAIDELTIPEGQVFGLAGESGSGKSMTGLAILGLVEHVGAWVRGSICFQGREIVGMSERELRDLRGASIGLILQGAKSAFSPVIRIERTFLGALRLHGAKSKLEARRQAEHALERVLLPPWALERYPHQLSGGQLQRVAIALSLALGAKLIVADEPTSALDVSVQAEVLELVASLRTNDRVSFLFISHDLSAMAEVADTIAIMNQGRIVEMGPAATVISAPRVEYTQQLLAAVPVL